MEPSRQKDRKGEMVKAIYLAGYNLPGARVRTYIKSKAVRGISWWGKARQIPIPGKGVRVSNFKLLAIDWARKGSEGMPSSRIVALAKEMKEDTLDKELSQVTPEEFEKENPNGYALLVSKATAEKDKIIGEMEAKVKEGEEDKKLLDEIRKSLKIDADADPLEKIATLMQKLGVKAKEAVDKALDSILEERIKDEKTRGIVKRMMPVAEMESKAVDAKNKEEVEKIVKEMTDASFNEDEIVKEMVSEESAPVVRRREEFMRGLGDTDKALKDSGMERERVTL